MKTMINTTNTRRILSTAILFTLVAGTIYSQGLLVDGASRLIQSIKSEKAEPEFTVKYANLSSVENEKSNVISFTNLRNLFEGNVDNSMSISVNGADEFETVILESFTVNNFDLTLESNLETEDWMTESFANDLETTLEVEDWMTESFSSNLEPAVETEEWMTTPLSESFEAPVTTEDWMSKPFVSDVYEQELSVETWMTLPLLSTVSEEEVEVEAWMTTPFEIDIEEELLVEDWMTQPLN